MPFLAVAAVAYIALGVAVSGSGPKPTNSMVGAFLFLIAGMLAGSALSWEASSTVLYGMGRALSFTSAGFIPVAFYLIYREYTVGAPHPALVAALCMVPAITVCLVVTNSSHNFIWAATETATGVSHTLASDHAWYKTVYAPFTYGLFGYSFMALTSRLSSIAPAHRKTIVLLLVCAILPFTISIANTFLGLGPPGFPLTSTTLALIWPMLAYASLKLRVHEFSPIAYQTLFHHLRDPVFVVDNEQRIICANKAAQQLLNGKESDLIGRKLWQDFPQAQAILSQARDLDMTQTLKMDPHNTFEVSVGPLAGPRGQNLGMVVVCRDVSEKRAAQRRLAESERLVRTLIETSSNGILRFSDEGCDEENDFRCVFANKAAEAFLGTESASLIGAPLGELRQLNPENLSRHFSGADTVRTPISFEVAADTAEGERWLRIVGEPVGDDFSVTLIDVTQRKQSEDKALEDALRDPLTGVLNRRGFEQEAAACIARSSTGAVLYLDLNQFKSINDQYGHHTGDAVLKAFGHRLESCLRPEDVLGRLGGDEFAIVLPGISATDVRKIAGRLIRTASAPYIIQGQELPCAASVGISLMPKHGDDLWHLVSVADRAMYDAKGLPQVIAANDNAEYVEAAIAS